MTIGMPVFDGADYMESSVRSLLAQTCADFELLICDNASTDSTLEIAHGLAKEDDRIRIFPTDRNRGAAWNFNRAVDYAAGRYFRWHAHDDLVAPDHLKDCLRVFESGRDAVLVYPRTSLIDAEGKKTGLLDDEMNLIEPKPHQRLRRFLRRSHQKCNPVFGLTPIEILRRTIRIGPFRASDRVLLAELLLIGPILEISTPLFFRREHSLSSLEKNTRHEDIQAWFDPANRDKRDLKTWRLLSEFAAAVRRAVADSEERRLCFGVLAGWAMRRSYPLAREAIIALPSSVGQLVVK